MSSKFGQLLFVISLLFSLVPNAHADKEEIPTHDGKFHFIAKGGTIIDGFYFMDEDIPLLKTEWRQLNAKLKEIEEINRQADREGSGEAYFSFYVRSVLDALGPDTPENQYIEKYSSAHSSYIENVGFLVRRKNIRKIITFDELINSEIYGLYSNWYREHYNKLGVWPIRGTGSKHITYNSEMCELATKDPSAKINYFSTEGTGVHIAGSPDIRLRFWHSRQEWLDNTYRYYNPNIMTNWFCFRMLGQAPDGGIYQLAEPEDIWIILQIQEIVNRTVNKFYCNAGSCYPQGSSLRSWHFNKKHRWKSK